MSSSAFFATSYKPQVLSRQEGFHLPSPPPANPPSPSAQPSQTNNFDPTNLFLPPFLSIPDPFRKFPSSADTAASMDFTDELASLINTHDHAQSHERSTQSPTTASYDEYRPPTHNIFDISAPTSHHHHHQQQQQHQHQQHHSASSHGHNNHAQQQPHSPFGPGPAAFSLPPSSSLHTNGGTGAGPAGNGLHDFASHAHFNSTLPALGSSMRYEPQPAPHSPFALNTPSGSGAEPSSFSSHISSLSGISSFSNLTASPSGPPDLLHHAHHRQTPSPDDPAHDFSRSRSRSTSRIRTATSQANANPPSTHGGPARRTRAKRNSVSSVSPPPLHRGHTQPLVIPGATSASLNSGNPRGPASPLGLHAGGWFIPGVGTPGQGEFSLPTPDSVHGGFSAFTGGNVPGLGVSPKDVGLGMKGGESPGTGDMAAKQALIANEKRRRRRESHNAVERRRRDNINEKISELATLIPECLLDPNATLSMPASLSASGEDLIFGMSTSTSAGPGSTPPAEGGNKAGSAKDGSAEPDEKDGGDQAGVVKANKGMILRKSVEYIRYLQQLVSAQASRNCDLEQQLQAFRSGGAGSPGSEAEAGKPSLHANGNASANRGANANGNANGAEEDGGLMLHEEVGGDFALDLHFGDPSSTNAHSAQGVSAGSGSGSGRARRRSKTFHGLELESVEEMEMDTDVVDVDIEDQDQDQDMEKSPSADSNEDDGDADAEGDGLALGEEEERGRKGRDGRPVGQFASKGDGQVQGVKVKEEREMETS